MHCIPVQLCEVLLNKLIWSTAQLMCLHSADMMADKLRSLPMDAVASLRCVQGIWTCWWVAVRGNYTSLGDLVDWCCTT